MTFDRRGRQVVFVRTEDVQVLDALTGEIKVYIPLFQRECTGRISALSASGRWFAVLGAEDVCLFDLEGRDPTTPLRKKLGEASAITGLALDANGTRLVTAHGDGTCQVWPLDTADSEPKPRTDDQDWVALAQLNPGLVHRHMLALLANQKGTVKLLEGKLSPAIECRPEQIQHWIDQLDADDFKARERAEQDLARVLDQVYKQLRAASKQPGSVEAGKRLKRLMEMSEDLGSDPERLRQYRAVELLERIGGPEALALLEKLAGGYPKVFLTGEARQSLERLRR